MFPAIDKKAILPRLLDVNPRNLELERLYADHAEAAFRFLLSLTRCEADTKDLLQDLFVRLARKLPASETIRDERSFLLTLAYRLFVDFCRRRGVRSNAVARLATEPSRLFDSQQDPDEEIFRAGVEKALTALPAEQCGVVYLKLWGGLTFEEIAGVMDIPANTAASRYRYGLDKLRAVLRPLYGELHES